MISKKILGFISVLVIILLLLASIPSGPAHVPGTNPADPPLDPGELPAGSPFWFFNYGHMNPPYGAYIRDVQWNSPTWGWDRYLGMLSVPWVRINGVQYMIPTAGAPPPVIWQNLPGTRFIVSYTYTLVIAGRIHNIFLSFDLQHTPPGCPTGMEGVIDITAIHSLPRPGVPPGPFTFSLGIRADFDINGLTLAPNYAWDHPGMWMFQPWEMTFTTLGPGDPVYGMDVAVASIAGMVPGSPAGPWAGFSPARMGPFNPDNYHLVAYNPPPVNEYPGFPAPAPASYVNGQNINGVDIVVWHETGFVTNPDGPIYPSTVAMTSRIYMI